jgi:hypothetical protein
MLRRLVSERFRDEERRDLEGKVGVSAQLPSTRVVSSSNWLEWCCWIAHILRRYRFAMVDAVGGYTLHGLPASIFKA